MEQLKADKTIWWIIGAGLVMALLNIAFIVTEQFWALLIPVVFLVIALTFLALDKVLMFIIFATPLSIFYLHPDLHLGFTLPTEPLLFGIMLLFFAKLLYRGTWDLKVLKHPLSVVIILNIFWMLITSITSELPLVSFKYLTARIWFVVSFFYLMSEFLKRPKRVYLFFWLYLLPLAAVVIYTLVIHAQWGFTKDASVWVMFPFFKEHTSYGAVLAMYIPVAITFTFFVGWDLNRRFLAGLLALILVVGVVMSFTRAAWVSLVAAGIVGLMIYVKLRKEIFFLLVALFFGILLYFQDNILQRFEKTEATSSDDLTEHVESISNISTDASNMERINRWKSAFRMFAERPVTGFGPGTYMFLYAPYQKPHEKTIISTNAGDLGNAHSEYIGPLAESGVFGLLTILLIVYYTVMTGLNAYYNLPVGPHKAIALAAIMGLVTYWTHGFLNNFLDMDKAALPVWGFTALLLIYRLYPKKFASDSSSR